LFLAGAMAAARAEDRATTRTFLAEADTAAGRLGRDANYLWTAFGPTNVDIHRVATAGELGDVQVAIDLGPRVDTTPLPMERRIRHALEVARAYSLWNRLDDALATPPAAELARLVGLGARVLATHESLTVLADPEGNEFCLLRRPPG
jgi:hypothetical protein